MLDGVLLVVAAGCDGGSSSDLADRVWIGEIDDDTFDRTLRELCEDLLDAASNRHAGVVEIDPALMDDLLLDIRDPLLQICLWKTMVDIVQADGHLDGRETTLVRRAARAWFGQDRAEDDFGMAALTT